VLAAGLGSQGGKPWQLTFRSDGALPSWLPVVR
jgi:hypothetical protein